MIDIHRFHTLYNRPFFTGTQQSSQNQGNFYKYIYIYIYVYVRSTRGMESHGKDKGLGFTFLGSVSTQIRDPRL